MEAYFTAFRRVWLSTTCSLLAACGGSEDTAVLRVTTHVLSSCPIEPRLVTAERLLLKPLGDFPDSAATELELAPRRARRLSIPAQTLAFEAATQGTDRFVGYSERGAHTSVPVLLWPEAVACTLGDAASNLQSYPARGGGQGIGHAASAHLLLVVGGRSPEAPSAAEGALVFDSGTGELSPVESSAPEEPRAFATVSGFGERLLIAGGENPLRGDEVTGTVSPSSTAEIFDPSQRRFTGTRVELSVERTRHAAVTLASGDTLLVGGRGRFGALRALEVVSAETGRASIAGLAALSAPRLFPAVLRLDDERWFVGGGTALDETPLAVLEWLSADARRHLGERSEHALQPRVDRAFAAMPGGGVLAVGGCEPREAEDASEATRCAAACNRGCPPARYDAAWVTPEGDAIALPDFAVDAPRPVLLGGADGRPLLASGGNTNEPLYRFDPWSARFEPAGASMPRAPRAGAISLTLDAAAFVWLDEESGPALYGLRLGTRNRFAGSGALLDAQSAVWPSELVPDRPISGELELHASGELVFSNASKIGVFVAGTDYAAFSLQIEASAPPRVVLGTLEYGGPERPWPEGAAEAFTLTRTRGVVTLSAARESITYAAPSGRVRVGIRAPAAGLRLRRLSLERSSE